MRDHTIFDKIDLHLIRVLHTVLTERSVSRAAVRLGMHQPAVSASLKRLRAYCERCVGRLPVRILPYPVPSVLDEASLAAQGTAATMETKGPADPLRRA